MREELLAQIDIASDVHRGAWGSYHGELVGDLRVHSGLAVVSLRKLETRGALNKLHFLGSICRFSFLKGSGKWLVCNPELDMSRASYSDRRRTEAAT